MPRKPRMYVPEIPCHVIQRGNNREACFFAEQDYQFYLECLLEASQRYESRIHAYVLMTNHVHLLVTPTKKDSISLTMQSVGRRYVQYINKEYKRTGTLWESRHKASLIDADNYLLTCMRYIEMNPVRANMVKHPAEYKWSSFSCNALGVNRELVQSHSVYQLLDKRKDRRVKKYLNLFDVDIVKQDIDLIRNSALFSVPTGDNRFQDQIEKMTGRKSGNAKRGRPVKELV